MVLVYSVNFADRTTKSKRSDTDPSLLIPRMNSLHDSRPTNSKMGFCRQRDYKYFFVNKYLQIFQEGK
jgi:hypothetical protein